MPVFLFFVITRTFSYKNNKLYVFYTDWVTNTYILTCENKQITNFVNGSVFQLVPQRFPKEIGVITGIVGVAGGFGGYLLSNNILGPLKQATGSHVEKKRRRRSKSTQLALKVTSKEQKPL